MKTIYFRLKVCRENLKNKHLYLAVILAFKVIFFGINVVAA
jgi:hypothetical protein